jgi:putative copper resistance protein D
MIALGTFFKYLSLIGSFTAIGTLLAMAFLLLDVEGKFSIQGYKLKRLLWGAAIVWSFGVAGTIIVTLATALDQSISFALDPTVLRSFITQITLGQYLFFELIVALVVVISAFRIKRILTATFILLLSIIGLVAPVFQSHSESSGSHGLAIGSLVIHVAALSLWVGGVIAIALLDPKDRPIAVSRFSELALWSVIAVVASGTVNAWVRLDFQGAWNSAYAYVVIAKIALTLVLVSIGYLHRTTLALRERIDWLGFGRLLFVESMIMVATVAMGAWLSSIEPPERPNLPEFDPAVAVSGISTPPPPSWSRILFSYEPDALMNSDHCSGSLYQGRTCNEASRR